MRGSVAVGTALVLLGMGTHAAAQGQGLPAPDGGRPDGAGDAETLTKRGLELRRERRDAEALQQFRHAYTLQPSPRLLAQIALAEQALGRWIDAASHLHESLGATDPWIDRNRGLLESGLAAIEGHLGRLEVVADAPGAELWVNDARVEGLPTASVRVEAGTVVIEVRAPGYATSRRITSVEPGGTARENVHLIRVAPADPPPPRLPLRRPEDEATHASIVLPSAAGLASTDFAMRNGYVVGAAGVVGLAAGAYFGARTFSVKSERDGHCTGLACDPTGLALDQEARSLALRSTVWFSFGAVGGVAGALFLWRSHASRAPARLHVDPKLGPNHAGAVVGGSF